MSFAQEERARLADQLLIVGENAPTLCDGWTARDLAIHLCMRERRTEAVLGSLLPLPGGVGKKYASRAQSHYEKKTFEELVDLIRSGPPLWSPFKVLDSAANTSEMFIHLEDVRRAQGERAESVPVPGEWFTRVFDYPTNMKLWSMVRRMSKILIAKDSAPVTFQWKGRNGITTSVDTPSSQPEVVVDGVPGEMLLWIFGRSEVELQFEGDPSTVKFRSL